MDQHKTSQIVLWSFMAASYCILLTVVAGPFKPDLDMHLTTYKVGHVASFALLGLLIAHYFRREFGISVFLGVTLTLLSCAFFGGLLELFQCLLPGRSPELRDISLDSVGALAGALAYGAHRIAAAGKVSPVPVDSQNAVGGILELLERR